MRFLKRVKIPLVLFFGIFYFILKYYVDLHLFLMFLKMNLIVMVDYLIMYVVNFYIYLSYIKFVFFLRFFSKIGF